MEKENFSAWLKETSDISDYTIGRFTNAIDTVSKDLSNFGIQEQNLYDTKTPEFIDQILVNPIFIEKNKKGHRMYSAALNHFKKFIKIRNEEFDSEIIKESYLYEERIAESLVLKKVVEKNIDKKTSLPSYKMLNNRKIWIRNPKHAVEAILSAKYLCEINNEHNHFISNRTTESYVEAHHLIPIKYQENFEYSIDLPANLVSVCVVCHKKLHHGVSIDKKEIITDLYHNRIKRLENCGININLDELLNFYEN